MIYVLALFSLDAFLVGIAILYLWGSASLEELSRFASYQRTGLDWTARIVMYLIVSIGMLWLIGSQIFLAYLAIVTP